MQVRKIGENRWRILLFCFAESFLLLLICSKSSILYPFNDWQDVNIIFTVGKGMFAGKVPYLDLYDQKGPLLFFLFGLASLVSRTSFLGLFLLEVLSFTAFLFVAYRLIALFVEKNRYLALPVLGALILSSLSMAHGGSAEQLCLPLFAFSLYRSVRYYQLLEPGGMSYREIFLHGFLAGCIFLIKYTMLGFYIAWMGVMAISLCANGKWKRAVLSCLLFLGAMLAASLPWLAYFAYHDALPAFYEGYFYNNIFRYSAQPDATAMDRILEICRHTLATFVRNAQYSLLTVLGMLFFSFRNRSGAKLWLLVNLWALVILTDVFIYIGGTGYRYYGLILSVFAILGMVPLLLLYNRFAADRPLIMRISRALPVVLTVLCMGVSLLVCDNTYLLKVKRDEMPQVRFAAEMQEIAGEAEPTLLCYRMLDAGFYTAADVIPENRFFTMLNLQMPEIAEEQARVLSRGTAEFVIARGWKVEEEDGYRKVMEMMHFYEGEWTEYWLCRRIDPFLPADGA